jgi:uncharacterized Tic20 family protein
MEGTKLNSFHPLPQPDDIPVREREDAMGAYLMMFASIGAGLPLPIINLIASIVYYYVNRGKSRFVRFHTHQSLLSQFPTSLINAGLVFWSAQIWLFQNLDFPGNVFWGYFWMAVAANLLYFIYSIVAAVKARKGQFYYLIFFGRLSYLHAYKVRSEEITPPVNSPPS